MGLYINRPNRLVIPRWRDFKDTANSGELAKEKFANSPKVPILSCIRQVENWNKEKSIANALELINSAFVSNERAAATAAANFVIDNCKDENNPAIKVAKLILDVSIDEQKRPTIETTFETLDLKIQAKISDIRRRLRVFPNNPVLWIDYARWFTVIGKFHEAEKYIKTAIQLSPENVFIIRCAVRFLIHKSKYDKKNEKSLVFALQLIRKNPATKFDPWLMATEISLCSYLEKTSNLMKAGFSLVEARNFSHFALAELNSALATVEMNHSTSQAKKLFNSSLIDPNENSLAQAQWASKKVGDLSVNLTKRNSHEASSYQKHFAHDWDGAFDEALNWLVDEPFSSEPANHASYLASASIDNNELSIKICNFGLRSNPNEFTLLNNKAYSLAVAEKNEEAEKTFSQIDFSKLTENEKVIYTATKGLINYRKGDHNAGSSLYDDAEALAKKNRDENTAFRVKIYKTRAEFICGCNKVDAITAFNQLESEAAKFKHPDLTRIMSNLKKRLGVTTDEKDDLPEKLTKK